MLVWSTGLAPNPLIESITDLQHDEKTHSCVEACTLCLSHPVLTSAPSLPSASDRRSALARLTVNDYFQPTYKDGTICEDVYVIGDCASLKEKLPATAQVANQEAKHLSKILNNHVRDRAPPGPFEFKNQGIMTYVGNWNALFDRTNASGGPKPKEAGCAEIALGRCGGLLTLPHLAVALHGSFGAVHTGRKLSLCATRPRWRSTGECPALAIFESLSFADGWGLASQVPQLDLWALHHAFLVWWDRVKGVCSNSGGSAMAVCPKGIHRSQLPSKQLQSRGFEQCDPSVWLLQVDRQCSLGSRESSSCLPPITSRISPPLSSTPQHHIHSSAAARPLTTAPPPFPAAQVLGTRDALLRARVATRAGQRCYRPAATSSYFRVRYCFSGELLSSPASSVSSLADLALSFSRCPRAVCENSSQTRTILLARWQHHPPFASTGPSKTPFPRR